MTDSCYIADYCIALSSILLQDSQILRFPNLYIFKHFVKHFISPILYYQYTNNFYITNSKHFLLPQHRRYNERLLHTLKGTNKANLTLPLYFLNEGSRCCNNTLIINNKIFWTNFQICIRINLDFSFYADIIVDGKL